MQIQAPKQDQHLLKVLFRVPIVLVQKMHQLGHFRSNRRRFLAGHLLLSLQAIQPADADVVPAMDVVPNGELLLLIDAMVGRCGMRVAY